MTSSSSRKAGTKPPRECLRQARKVRRIPTLGAQVEPASNQAEDLRCHTLPALKDLIPSSGEGNPQACLQIVCCIEVDSKRLELEVSRALSQRTLSSMSQDKPLNIFTGARNQNSIFSSRLCHVSEGKSPHLLPLRGVICSRVWVSGKVCKCYHLVT